MKKNENNIIIYQDEDGITKVSVKFSDEDIWLTQKIAKNYLSEIELQRLNLLVSQFLDFAEIQALEQRAKTMNDWINELDNQIIQNKRRFLEGKGKISHQEAIEKAEREFQIYRDREMKQLESDFDKMLKMLKDNNKQ